MIPMLFPPWLLQLDMAGEEPIPVTAALGQRLQSHCVLASLFARASLRGLETGSWIPQSRWPRS